MAQEEIRAFMATDGTRYRVRNVPVAAERQGPRQEKSELIFETATGRRLASIRLDRMLSLGELPLWQLEKFLERARARERP